jgi:hypothetical protein
MSFEKERAFPWVFKRLIFSPVCLLQKTAAGFPKKKEKSVPTFPICRDVEKYLQAVIKP